MEYAFNMGVASHFAIHLFFFLWGFATITDENMSNYSFGLENHFEGLPMVMSFIIIVLMLVGWFIRLFKNNAFKRFLSCE